jgi:hypothetical protein
MAEPALYHTLRLWAQDAGAVMGLSIALEGQLRLAGIMRAWLI